MKAITNRQMLEQTVADAAMPKAYMDDLMKRMVLEQERRLLEASPFVRIKSYGDKIKIATISPDKFYLQSGMSSKAMEDADNYIEKEDNRIVITLKNGVYE